MLVSRYLCHSSEGAGLTDVILIYIIIKTAFLKDRTIEPILSATSERFHASLKSYAFESTSALSEVALKCLQIYIRTHILCHPLTLNVNVSKRCICVIIGSAVAQAAVR